MRIIRLLSAALLWLGVALSDLQAQTEGTLLSEGFEDNFQADPNCKQGVCNVPAGWGVWYVPRTENDPPGVNFQPQADRAPGRARSGAAAQRLWVESATFTGGIYRIVTGVPVGARVRFTIWGRVWSTNDNSPISSRPSRDIRVKVGIDPLGGDNGRPSPFNGQVIWSAEQEAKDAYTQFSVEAEARAATVILYTYTTMKDSVRHNEVFWDDATLEVTAPPATPTPEVTATPELAALAAPQAQPTPIPTPEPAVTHTVKAGDTLFGIALAYNVPLETLYRNNPGVRAETLQIGQVLVIKPGAPTSPPPPPDQRATTPPDPSSEAATATPTMGQACVQAFFDDNGNGLRDEAEELVPDIAFTVTAGGTTFGSYVTTGNEPHCFDLPNQAYTVAARAPDAYVATTPLNDTVRVNGARAFFSVGLRRVSDGFADVSATPTPQPPIVPDSNTTLGLLATAGGALLLIGVVGLALSVVLRARRL
jgi:LysM repeat protein